MSGVIIAVTDNNEVDIIAFTDQYCGLLLWPLTLVLKDIDINDDDGLFYTPFSYVSLKNTAEPTFSGAEVCYDALNLSKMPTWHNLL